MGVNTYLNKIFLHLIFNTFAKNIQTCFHLVIMGYCV
jgi:hypothetical protein